MHKVWHIPDVKHPVGPLRTYRVSGTGLKPHSLEERLAPRRACTDHPHLRDPTVFEPVDEGVVCIERSPIATELGPLPFRSPALIRNRELLIELHISRSQVHDSADNS